jgi:hypothetical protein
VENNINAKADKATLALVIKEGIRAFSRVKNLLAVCWRTPAWVFGLPNATYYPKR